MAQRVFPPEPTSQDALGAPPFPPTIRDGQRLRMVVVNDRANSTASAVVRARGSSGSRRDGPSCSTVSIPRDTDLAVVVAGQRISRRRGSPEAIGRLRDGKVAVLVLAADEDDDVVLQDCTTVRNGGTLVSLELARRIRARLRNVPLGLLRFGSLTIDVRRPRGSTRRGGRRSPPPGVRPARLLGVGPRSRVLRGSSSKRSGIRRAIGKPCRR